MKIKMSRVRSQCDKGSSNSCSLRPVFCESQAYRHNSWFVLIQIPQSQVQIMSVNRTCTSRHIPTFHGGQSCPNPVAEAHPVNEKTPKADAAVVVRGIGIIPVRIPINQVAAQKDRSRFSTTRHPWFLNIFEPCQRWQLTEFRCLYSASWCVWALQLRATNATRTTRYQKVNFQGRNQI